MATKPQPVPWDELNDLRYDLFEWLVAQRLAKPKETPLVAVFRLQSEPKALGRLSSLVIAALLDIELFAAACNRADGDQRRLTELPEALRAAFFDDRIERETDRAIRGLVPSIQHVQRLLKKTSSRRAMRAKTMRLPEQSEESDELEVVLKSVAGLLARHARLLHRAFVELHPSIPSDELTLAGFRRLERRIRAELLDAGFPAEKPKRRR